MVHIKLPNNIARFYLINCDVDLYPLTIQIRKNTLPYTYYKYCFAGIVNL